MSDGKDSWDMIYAVIFKYQQFEGVVAGIHLVSPMSINLPQTLVILRFSSTPTKSFWQHDSFVSTETTLPNSWLSSQTGIVS